jgi:hypothetical protein
MTQYQRFEVEGSDEQIRTVIRRLDDALSPPWTRDVAYESILLQSGGMERILYVHSGAGTHPPVRLWLEPGNGRLVLRHVGTVDDRAAFDLDYCNQVALEFYRTYVRPIADELGLAARHDIESVKHDIQAPAPETSQTHRAVEALRMFVESADRSSPAVDPPDEERWFHFVLAAHRERSGLTESDIAQYLIDNGWADEAAHAVSAMYRYGRDLLSHYDNS